MSHDEVFVRHMLDAIDQIDEILKDRTYLQLVNDMVRMPLFASLKSSEKQRES